MQHECDKSATRVTQAQHDCDTIATRVKIFDFDNDTTENIFLQHYINYMTNERLQRVEEKCTTKTELCNRKVFHM